MKPKAFSYAVTMLAFSAVHAANSADNTTQPKTTAQQEMESVNYLIGKWSCSHVIGTSPGSYTATYSKVLGDRWLEEIYDFPAQQNGPTVTAWALMSFDERRQTWVRYFVNSVGYHFEIRMTDTPNGWSYKYASLFPETKSETPDPDAVFTKKSDTEYTIEGPTYPANGTLVTQHDACHKA